MRVVLGGLVVLAVLALAACEDSVAPPFVEFEIHVDSVKVVSPYADGDSLRFYFYALLGPNQCWKFDHFDVGESNNEIVVWLVGHHDLASKRCEIGESRLTARRLTLEPHPVGSYQLLVVQPNQAENITHPFVVAPAGVPVAAPF